MSTLANAVFSNDDSDSENDPDFIPEAEAELKDVRLGNAFANHDDNVVVLDDEKERKRQNKEREDRAALWANFQSSIASPSSTVATGSTGVPTAPKAMVKIEKKYRFAGEDVVEIVEVPEDSPEAKKWPHWQPPTTKEEKEAEHRSRPEERSATPELSPLVSTPLVTLSRSSSTVRCPSEAGPSIPATTTTVATKSRPKPGPRKPKQPLPTLPTSKPKKLTTLEKSAMDWRSHLNEGGTDDLDALERHRKDGGGGYLERMAFLNRVGERREEVFEKNKDGKRRRV